jgi:hypothetical protein
VPVPNGGAQEKLRQVSLVTSDGIGAAECFIRLRLMCVRFFAS